MFADTIALIAAKIPSSIKYKAGRLRPLYTRILRFRQSSVVVKTTAGNLRWNIDALTSQQFLLGSYEPYMQAAFRRYVRRASVVFDVGAHAGFHSLFCALLVCKEGQVFAFEPNPISRQSLVQQVN